MRAPGRPLPTTFEQLEVIALREPGRLAFVQERHRWTYGALYLDIVRATRVLHATGVKRGERVAVGVQGFQVGLLLLLALENLGAVTLSFLAEGDTDAAQVFALVDWVLCDRPCAGTGSAKFIAVDAAFVHRVESEPADEAKPFPREAVAADEPFRISRTSGSSGRSKFMLMTRHSQECWIAGVAQSAGLLPDSRALIVGPLLINSHFARACACLRRGAAVLHMPAASLPGHDVTHVFTLPLLLEELLAALPPTYAPPRPAKVCTLGGFVSQSLRVRASRAFGLPVVCRYASNEIGEVCGDVDENGLGVLTAGVEVRIVDSGGDDVPAGEAGIIAVRTPGMVEGYIDNAPATEAAFHGGWFLSGDWGTLVAPRVIRLMGRHDEIVSAGGIKVAISQIEDQVRRAVGPRDCAVAAINLDSGETTLGIALVMDGDVARDDVRRTLAQHLQFGLATGARVLFVTEIPRVGMAKVDRAALLRTFESPPPGSL